MRNLNNCRQFALLTTYTVIILFLVSCTTASGQGWTNVGSPDFTFSGIISAPIAIDTGGTPYVVIADSTSGRATVMKYSGGNWVVVGSPAFSSGSMSIAFSQNYPVIAFDRTGTPYIAYVDGGISSVMAMKFNGTDWVNVGSGIAVTEEAQYLAMAIDSAGTPYVAYADLTAAQQCTVKKFDGTSWVVVGTALFSTAGVENISIAINPGGTPYVCFQGGGTFNTGATVMKFDGTAWVNVGITGFVPDGAYWPSMAIDRNGTPYVAYSDYSAGDSYSYQATVMKFDGTNWVNVGSPAFSSGAAYGPRIVIDSFGVPYVGFVDASLIESYYDKATVMKFNGSSWVPVGGAGFSPGPMDDPWLAIDSKGTLYFSFTDSLDNYRITVMKCNTVSEVPEVIAAPPSSFSAYPDPSQGAFTIRISSATTEKAIITVTNILGEKTNEFITSTNTDSPVQLDVSTGIYFLTATMKNETVTTKVLVK